jgi:transposase InsO family protein
MGRVGSCFDDAAAETFFSSLEGDVSSRHDFTSTGQAQAVVIEWCDGSQNHQRRHGAGGGQPPINYETPPSIEPRHKERCTISEIPPSSSSWS